MRHPELVWLLFPKSIDFVENVWFSTGSHSTLIEMLKQVQHDILSKGTVRPCILSQKTHARSLFTNEFHSLVSAKADDEPERLCNFDIAIVIF